MSRSADTRCLLRAARPPGRSPTIPHSLLPTIPYHSTQSPAYHSAQPLAYHSAQTPAYHTAQPLPCDIERHDGYVTGPARRRGRHSCSHAPGTKPAAGQVQEWRTLHPADDQRRRGGWGRTELYVRPSWRTEARSGYRGSNLPSNMVVGS